MGRVNPFGCQFLFGIFLVAAALAVVSTFLGASDSVATILFVVVLCVLFALALLGAVAQFFEKK